MTSFAVVLITIAAVSHATWNMLAKRAMNVRLFAWLSCSAASIVYAPLFAYILLTQQHDFSPVNCGAIAVFALVCSLGFNSILLSYKFGDYSIMYPVTRGTGPLVATLAAILFLNERPSLAALAGISLIIAGVFFISGGTNIKSIKSLKPIIYGILTGCIVATTTVWSKFCISNLGIHFVLIDYIGVLGMLTILTPYALSKKEDLKEEWQKNRSSAFGVGFLRSFAFLIVLFVLSTTPVYYVAPLREMSILFAAIIGAKLLKEGQLRRRFAAALIMFTGLVSLSIS